MKYGCIGEHLGHSFSKEIHNALADYEYAIREIPKDELADFAECGLCGTAAVISPVGKIVDHGKEIVYGMDSMGPVTQKLYDTLRGIQMGTVEAPEGWIMEI